MVKRDFLFVFLLMGIFTGLAAQGAFTAKPYFESLNRLSPHPPGSENHKKVCEYIQKTLISLGWEVQTHSFSYISPYDGPQEGTNIIGLLRGTQERAVAFGSHWDTRPVADQDPDRKKRREPVFGANDGNSSTAALLSLAEMLAGSGPLEHTVYLFFFDAEDSGSSSASYCIGSNVFVEEWDISAVRFGVLVDIIGSKSLSLPYEGYSVRAAPGLSQNIWDYAIKEKRIPFFRKNTGPHVIDDHLPFLERGIPFVCLIDFSYPWWHTTEDTPDKCSLSNIDMIVSLLFDIAVTPRKFYPSF